MGTSSIIITKSCGIVNLFPKKSCFDVSYILSPALRHTTVKRKRRDANGTRKEETEDRTGPGAYPRDRRKTSYFEKDFDQDNYIEMFERLSDAKKSPYLSVYKQLLSAVKEAAKARKAEK